MSEAEQAVARAREAATKQGSGAGHGVAAGPFAGVKVVEFGRFIAVPYCGQLLADGGAEVVKVEPLGGDQARGNGLLPTRDSRQFINKNRGKRSLAIDLSRGEVSEIVARLVGRADVVLANFRPGVAERLGLDYETLSGSNPGLIYAVNTGFGELGPLGGTPGVDVVVQAYSGLCHMGPDGPSPQPEPLIDYTAALLMAFGVATALYHRVRTGRGQRLDVSLLQASMLLQNNHIGDMGSADEERRSLSAWLKEAFASGLSWVEVLGRWQAVTGDTTTGPLYGIVATADGYLAVGGGGADLRSRIAAVLGVDGELEGEPGSPDLDRSARAVFGRRPTAEWLARLSSAGIPAGPLRFREQLLDDEQAWANGYLVRLPHPRLGEFTVVGPPLRLGGSPLRAGSTPPDLGEHTRAVLESLGVGASRIEALIQEGALGASVGR